MPTLKINAGRLSIKTKTHCVIITAFYPNIGHMYWPPVRGNKWFFCTDLLAASRWWPPVRGHLLGKHVNAQRKWPLMPGGRPSEGPFKRGSTVFEKITKIKHMAYINSWKFKNN